MKLDRAVFTIVDVETTGLYPYSGDKICEIGVLRIGPKGPYRQKGNAPKDR